MAYDEEFCRALGIAHESTKRTVADQAVEQFFNAALRFESEAERCLRVARAYRRRFRRLMWIAAAWFAIETGVILWLISK